MDVTFYNFSKRFNSTAQPTGGTTVNCAMRSGYSDIHPKIEYRGNAPTYNYMKIGSNYYYITDKTFNSEENFFIVEGERDVFATYRNSILGSYQAILRTSHTDYQTPYIADSLALPIAQPYRIASSFGEALIGDAYTNSRPDQTVILAVAGRGFICTTMGQYDDLISDMFYTQSPTDELAKWVIDPASWFIGQMAFPIKSEEIANSSPFEINVAWWRIRNVFCWRPKTSLSYSTTVQVPIHPQSDGNPDHYLNHPPYASYSLYVSGFGQVAIDSNKIRAGEVLNVYLYIDLMSGGAKIKLINAGNQVVAYSVAQMGYDVAFASRNPPNVIGAVSAPLMGAAVGGAVGLAGGAIGAINSLTGGQGGITTGSTGGAGGWADYASSRIEATFRRVTEYSNVKIGRPSDRTLYLSTLEGYYVECLSGHVSCGATPTEKNMIDSTLRGGIYLD